MSEIEKAEGIQRQHWQVPLGVGQGGKDSVYTGSEEKLGSQWGIDEQKTGRPSR
jgi:hypothetical protein